MTPESDALRPQFNASELTALVDESQAAGKRVAAHALCTAAIRQAVQAGVDTIEHGLWRDENGRFDWDETVVSLMAQRGVAVTATLGGYLRAWAVPDQVGHPRAALMEFWQQYARLRAAGVRVIAASDGGVRVTPIEQPAGMLCLLVSGFGLTTPEALELLTAEPAAALGVRDRGWLGAGARADVVAVDGELERDPSRLGRVRMVMLNGAIVKA